MDLSLDTTDNSGRSYIKLLLLSTYAKAPVIISTCRSVQFPDVRLGKERKDKQMQTELVFRLQVGICRDVTSPALSVVAGEECRCLFVLISFSLGCSLSTSRFWPILILSVDQ